MLSHFSHVQPFATPWTVTHQAPLSMGFSRQEHWSGLPCPPPGDLPDPGIEPTSLMSPLLTGEFFTTSAPRRHSLTLQTWCFFITDLCRLEKNQSRHSLELHQWAEYFLPGFCSFVLSHFSTYEVKLKVLVTQSRPTLCHPVDCSPPGSSVHGILQARILEWVAMPSSRGLS